MFTNKDKTEILFLGSSRFSDGVSAKVFREQLESSELHIKAFNGGITGATMERLQYFFDEAIKKEGLKHIIVEISRPQLKKTASTPEIDTEENIDEIEDELAGFFEEHSKLIRWRKSLRIDNLKNIPIIAFSKHLEGSEVFRRGGFSEIFSDNKTTVDQTVLSTWNPSVIAPNELNITVDEVALNSNEKYQKSSIIDYSFITSILNDVVKKAKEKHVEIIFVVPPLVNKRLKEEHNKEFLDLYQSIANNTGISMYDFTAIDIPENYFRDKDSHLNKAGRDLFSVKLAEIMIQELHKTSKNNVVQ